ncbi:MAG: HPr(Ser) kinase/phosphatase, partial [Oscillospiraceae bacterium]
MSAQFTVSLSKIIKDLGLEVIYLPPSDDDILISSADINRPGLNLTGFFEYFDPSRIQILGRMEFSYLDGLDPEIRKKNVCELFAQKFPAVIITRGLDISQDIIDAVTQYGVACLRTPEPTSNFMSGIISYLNVELAPRITRHGVLIEAYGEGVLLLGESGVGKSETAIELVKRGHRLIADDAVEIRRVSNKTLVGTSPENIRHFLEVRGIGIINARRLFGMGAVKVTEKIDMIVKLENWDPNKVYDRMGLEDEFATILGIQVPSLTIP